MKRKSLKIDPTLHRKLKALSKSHGMRMDYMADDMAKLYLASFTPRKVERKSDEE